MLKRLIASGFVFCVVSHAAGVVSTKTTSVLCSITGPRTDGFELVRVYPRKELGKGEHRVRASDLAVQGSYDLSLRRLKARVVQLDESGDEVQFLSSIDAVVASGEHLRTIFMKPSETKPGVLEAVELVCNVVAH